MVLQIKKKSFCFILILLFLLLTQSVHAENNLRVKNNEWTLYQNQGNINLIEDQKIITTTTGNIRTHPFAISDISSFISSDYELNFILSFPKITPYGVGFRTGNLAVQNDIPINDFGNLISQGNNFAKLIHFQFWQDLTNKFHIWFCPDNLNTHCVLNPKTNLSLNQNNDLYNKITNDLVQFRILKVGQSIKTYIKNITKNSPEELLFESVTTRVPQYLLLGNNVRNDVLGSFTDITLEKSYDTNPFPPSKPKLILIPGLFGSWNKDAMLHNTNVNQSDWKLNPIVTEYNGIIDSLKNLGYQENSDFYVFPYDWRQPIANSANDLNSFITQRIPDSNTKFSILAHSEGGLVARAYAQQQGTDRVDKIVTVGTPHKGTAASYKAVEAGDVEADNPIDFMAKKIILQANKNTFFESDRKRLNTIAPILKDFLPTYDFLTNSANQPITVSSMKIKNDFLLNLQNTFASFFSKLVTFYGEKTDTLWGYKVGPQTIFDKFYDLYPDGHPTNKLFNSGDNLIVTASAAAGDDTNILVEKNHGEIVTDSIAIKQMFTKLNIPYQDNQIVVGHETKIFPGLLFLIQSPAVMHVTYDGKQIDEKDGMIFIENAPTDAYNLKIEGTEVGNYTIHVGQFINDKVTWDTVHGSISNPGTEVDTYAINFNNQNPQPHIINQNNPLALFDALISKLTQINDTAPNQSIIAAINSLQTAKKLFIAHNKSKLLLEFQNTYDHLFQTLKGTNTATINQLLEATDKFENLYDVALTPFAFTPDTNGAAQTLAGFRLLVDKSYERLLALKAKGKDITVPTMYLQSIETKLVIGKIAISNNNSRLVTIIIQSIGKLLILVNNFK